MSMTRNQAQWQHYRGFGSHPPLQVSISDGPEWPVLHFYIPLYLSQRRTRRGAASSWIGIFHFQLAAYTRCMTAM